MLRNGSRGYAVQILQYQLNTLGFKLSTDGNFGPMTESAVKIYQTRNGLGSDGVVGPVTQRSLQNNFIKMNIVDRFLPAHCYFAENTPKKRICLHHTVGGPMAINGVIATWSGTRSIATTYVINGDGVIYKVIPQNFWAHHLGLKVANNTQLNKETIGIEVNAWGPVTLKNGRYMNAYDRAYDMTYPIEKLDKPFRGWNMWQEYLDVQMYSLFLLIRHLCNEHNIPYEGICRTKNFELMPTADFTKPGIFNHTNYRADKSDMYPGKKLITMLNNLV